ncbi:hypothetical protein MtrunA17_Chr3g0101281 [Medicago truncatula]|uniref:Transmembrane protein n=1 Tax=Medicago truncatula TaxID=3880 RepID=A0A396IWH4_MEDTR|nr:hypothetical protein MtrunA17_Chr3g0101281 [Medicago truncatula]
MCAINRVASHHKYSSFLGIQYVTIVFLIKVHFTFLLFIFMLSLFFSLSTMNVSE